VQLWYAAFGSNLSRDRFLVYLHGGVPAHSPNPTPQPGARDQSPPTAEWTGEIDAELYFGATSQRWGGGGVAFLDVDPTSWTRPLPRARMRAYRISLAQLEDVFGQENGLDDPPSIDIDALLSAGRLDALSTRYGRLAIVGTHDGAPLITITSATRQVANNPSFAYARTIVSGLVDAFGLSLADATSYLAENGVDAEMALSFGSRLRDN